jgi:hypothetical protein
MFAGAATMGDDIHERKEMIISEKKKKIGPKSSPSPVLFIARCLPAFI